MVLICQIWSKNHEHLSKLGSETTKMARNSPGIQWNASLSLKSLYQTMFIKIRVYLIHVYEINHDDSLLFVVVLFNKINPSGIAILLLSLVLNVLYCILFVLQVNAISYHLVSGASIHCKSNCISCHIDPRPRKARCARCGCMGMSVEHRLVPSYFTRVAGMVVTHPLNKHSFKRRLFSNQSETILLLTRNSNVLKLESSTSRLS